MFWIYIPPIILIAALAALAIILGKKSADLKRGGLFQTDRDAPGRRAGVGERIKLIGGKSLHLLEKALNVVKGFFRKTEPIIASWVMKLRAKRNGKGLKEIGESSRDGTGKPSADVRLIREIERAEEVHADIVELDREEKLPGREVIARRKIVEPAPVIKKEILPEDKVREAALIYRIAENPRDIEAYRELGDYYLGVGNIKDAKESFKMVLKLRPRDLKAKSCLREIEMRMRLGS